MNENIPFQENVGRTFSHFMVHTLQGESGIELIMPKQYKLSIQYSHKTP